MKNSSTVTCPGPTVHGPPLMRMMRAAHSACLGTGLGPMGTRRTPQAKTRGGGVKIEGFLDDVDPNITAL